MSVVVDWMDANYSVIHANFIDQWNWSELYSAIDHAHILISHKETAITLMLDFIGSSKVSATSALFKAAGQVDAPQVVERVVIISDNAELGRKMVKLLSEIYPEADEILLTKNHEQAFDRVRSTMEMVAIS